MLHLVSRPIMMKMSHKANVTICAALGTSIQYPRGPPPPAWLWAALTAAVLWPFYR